MSALTMSTYNMLFFISFVVLVGLVRFAYTVHEPISNERAEPVLLRDMEHVTIYDPQHAAYGTKFERKSWNYEEYKRIWGTGNGGLNDADRHLISWASIMPVPSR
jgi:hypothetical protein